MGVWYWLVQLVICLRLSGYKFGSAAAERKVYFVFSGKKKDVGCETLFSYMMLIQIPVEHSQNACVALESIFKSEDIFSMALNYSNFIEFPLLTAVATLDLKSAPDSNMTEEQRRIIEEQPYPLQNTLHYN
uniref:Uncharacterized protein n=1 Tax=Rhodnius prolixus TaxID=13249 RepID=T1HUM5_RHOPR